MKSNYSRPWGAKSAADWAVMVREDVERHASLHPRGDLARWAGEVAQKAPSVAPQFPRSEASENGTAELEQTTGRQGGTAQNSLRLSPGAAELAQTTGRHEAEEKVHEGGKKQIKSRKKQETEPGQNRGRVGAESGQSLGAAAEVEQTPGRLSADLLALEEADPICREIKESLLTAYSVGAPGRVEELHRRMAERRRELLEGLQEAL